jgi:hypothetical protein
MPHETHEPIAARRRPIVSWVLRSEQGFRGGWLALGFVVIYQGLTIATTPVVARLISLAPTGPIPPTLALIRESWEVLLVLSATWLMARVERRPILSFGYADSRGGVRLLSGTVWGFLALSVLIGVLWMRGSLVFDGTALGGLTACSTQSLGRWCSRSWACSRSLCCGGTCSSRWHAAWTSGGPLFCCRPYSHGCIHTMPANRR